MYQVVSLGSCVSLFPKPEWHCPYRQKWQGCTSMWHGCDMVVTSLYTRNMLSTTLSPGCYNLVKPGDKLVSLYKVVTSCHKTLHKFEIIKLLQNLGFYLCCCCYQAPACDMHMFRDGVCWFEEHACNAQNTYHLATILGVVENQAACSEPVVLYPASVFREVFNHLQHFTCARCVILFEAHSEVVCSTWHLVSSPDIQFFARALRPCRKIGSGHVHW